MRTCASITTASPPDRERGLGLVELLVVMLIVAIILSLGVSSLRGSKDTGGRFEVRAAASRYADAIERYQADHGRKVPVLGNVDSWPLASVEDGPRSTVVVGSNRSVQYYMKKPLPEGMARRIGGVDFANAPAAQGGTLVYRPSGQFDYMVQAYWNGKLVCTAGNVPAAANHC